MLTTQYREHPGWTAQLHYDNLHAALQGHDVMLPSYPTIRRYLKAHGLFRQSRPKRATAGASAGSPIWMPPVGARCCSSTKPRR